MQGICDIDLELSGSLGKVTMLRARCSPTLPALLTFVLCGTHEFYLERLLWPWLINLMLCSEAHKEMRDKCRDLPKKGKT